MTDGQKKQAWVTALRLLAATPKSSRELEKKLTEKGYPETVIRDTLSGLQEKGILDDFQYARNVASRFVYGKPSGMRKIEFELKKRHISPEIREDILGSLTEEEERERAREIGRMKWDAWARLSAEKRKKKTYDFLVRRGFDFSVARDLIEEFTEAVSR
jgi:regulatory protein